MVFSSNLFLFYFLPFVLSGYHLTSKRFQNLFLFFASSLFYIWGGGSQIILLYLYILVNFVIGKELQNDLTKAKSRKALLIAGIGANLSLLIYFKYLSFIIDTLKWIFPYLELRLGSLNGVALPVGISFFTFQAISYLVEIYRKEEIAQKNIIDFGVFLACFPHLVAGPVVRYSDISHELKNRRVSIDLAFDGFLRFSIGLAKKVLIANHLGAVANQVFTLPSLELTTPIAWLGILSYTFQIYFDFSGYSDMAIGLAKMFGFNFPENFQLPYSAKTITEFWRRWHITLSLWFRDFLYIPLGGNRKGEFQTYLNLFAVFFLCGLWHGANWTFAIWGFYHGILLVLERWLRGRWNFELSGTVGNIITFLLVAIGWVFFRAETWKEALHFLHVLFFGAVSGLKSYEFFPFAFYLRPETIFYLIVAFVFSVIDWKQAFKVFNEESNFIWKLKGVMGLSLFLLSAVYLSTSGFNPFIYFRF